VMAAIAACIQATAAALEQLQPAVAQLQDRDEAVRWEGPHSNQNSTVLERNVRVLLTAKQLTACVSAGSC
jgi:hypothetical protein